MKILFLRHGQTQGNVEKRYVGGRTDEPLTDKGKAALRRLDAEFAAEAIYVSPMKRTLETANICFADSEITVIENLREMLFGVFEAKRYDELENDERYKAWVDSMCTDKCPGGESLNEFDARIDSAFFEIIADAKAKGKNKIAIVAHGGVFMSLLNRYADEKREYFDWFMKNGCGYTVEFKEDNGPVLTNIEVFS